MTATSPAASARPVYTDIGKALGTDYFLLKGDLSAEERDYLERTGGSSTRKCSRRSTASGSARRCRWTCVGG